MDHSMDRVTACFVFIAIVERGSMTAAAESLDLSRAMVTRYLSVMEQWAGARLLHRTTRRLSLTPAGEATLLRCRQLLDIANEIPSAVGDLNEQPSGLLRVSCSQSLAQDVLTPAITDFLLRYPKTSVDLHINDRIVNLVQERIDLAIRVTNELDPNLIARPLGKCASVVCAAPAYLAKHGIPRIPEDLALHNCMPYTHFNKSLWQFNGPEGVTEVLVGGNLSANESNVLLSATLQGTGIAMLPAYAARPGIDDGRLVLLLAEWQPQTLGIYGVYNTRRQMSAALRALLDLLVERFADPRYWTST
ncbi:LysR family transcriptional regulator [Acinetobacter proteolyticus]|uniref:LysR family transcriptional regulator n=1 Tax=Acinetobacter proteolyticus TaxID=1776741 RepID=UPI0031D493A5